MRDIAEIMNSVSDSVQDVRLKTKHLVRISNAVGQATQELLARETAMLDSAVKNEDPTPDPDANNVTELKEKKSK